MFPPVAFTEIEPLASSQEVGSVVTTLSIDADVLSMTTGLNW